MLAAKQVRERAAVFVALAAVSLVVSGLGVGLNGYLANAEAAGVRVELGSLAGSDLALEVSLARSDAPAAQDTEMRELLTRELPTSLAITTTVTSNLRVNETGGSTLVLLSLDDLTDVATIVDGSWPTSPREVAVQAGAATALGLAVGSSMQLGPDSVTVAATWLPDDALAGRWLGDRLIADGTDGTDAGPVVIDESLWDELPVSARTRWALTADPATIQPGDLDGIISGWESLPAAIRSDDAVYDVSFGQRGRLATVANENLSNIESLRAVIPVALLTIGAIALLTIFELARLLVTLRASEYRLMWARGSTANGLAATAAAETAVFVIPGAILGVALSSGALVAILGDQDAAARAPVWSWVTPIAAAAAITLSVAATTWTSGRALEARDPSARSTRPGRFVGMGAVVLVALAAALSTWQLLLYGTPITVSRNGRSQIDPVAVLAPALLLVAVVLVTVAAVTGLAPALQGRTRRLSSVRAALASSTMVRRLRITVIPLVLCALVSGQFVVAASYAATWDASFTQSRQLRTGSTLTLGGSALTETDIAQAASVTGVTGVAPVIVQNTPIGIEQASLVAATPDAVRSLAADGSGLVDVASIADAISTAQVGAPLATGNLTFTTTFTGLSRLPTMAALLTDDLGGLHTVSLEPDAGGSSYSGAAEAGWQLIGFDVVVPTDVAIDRDLLPTVTITGGTIDLAIPWTAFALGSLNSELPRTGDPIGFTLYDSGPMRIVSGANLSASLGADAGSQSPIPVVVSQLLADRTGVGVGDFLPVVVDLRMDPVITTVAAIVPAVPGAQREFAAMIDLATVRLAALGLYDAHPTATQAWVQSADPNLAATALRADLPSRVSVMTLANDQSRSILGSAAVALWIGAAGAAVLALLALVTVIIAQLRSRRGEVVLLRALGLDAASTASSRRIELGIAAAAGLVTGVIAGIVVALLTVPAMARAAVPDAFLSVPTTPSVAIIPLAAGLGAFLVCLLVILFGYGAAVARQAWHLSVREPAG